MLQGSPKVSATMPRRDVLPVIGTLGIGESGPGELSSRLRWKVGIYEVSRYRYNICKSLGELCIRSYQIFQGD